MSISPLLALADYLVKTAHGVKHLFRAANDGVSLAAPTVRQLMPSKRAVLICGAAAIGITSIAAIGGYLWIHRGPANITPAPLATVEKPAAPKTIICHPQNTDETRGAAPGLDPRHAEIAQFPRDAAGNLIPGEKIDETTGDGSAIDGHTVAIGGWNMRLAHISSCWTGRITTAQGYNDPLHPQAIPGSRYSSESYALEAVLNLEKPAGRLFAPITCRVGSTPAGRVLGGRPMARVSVGECFTATGRDIASDLVKSGWAMPMTGDRTYESQAREAEAAKRGMWAPPGN